MRYLSRVWDKVCSDIKTAGHIFLALDYDGTLTPIVKKPGLALLSKATKKKLINISRCRRFTACIISGRAMDDIQKKVGIKNIYYGGNHGLEIRGPGMRFVSPGSKRIKPIMRFLERELSKKLKHIKGAFVENKSLTLSVHYRLVQTGQVNKVKNIFHSTLRPFARRKRIRVTSGKKVLEVRPRVELDKGKAILLIVRKLSLVRPGVLPIYAGDDKTDESAFKVVNKKKGLSIFVGGLNRRSSAKYYLKSTKEVNTFLERMKRLCLIIAIITAAGISGCVGTRGGAIGTLIEVGRSEEYKQEALKQETTSFNRVKKCIRENTIEKGISKKAAVSKFGRPVLMTPKEGYEKWAYKPGDSDWFGGEKIYLFFDKNDKLISWKVVNEE